MRAPRPDVLPCVTMPELALELVTVPDVSLSDEAVSAFASRFPFQQTTPPAQMPETYWAPANLVCQLEE